MHLDRRFSEEILSTNPGEVICDVREGTYDVQVEGELGASHVACLGCSCRQCVEVSSRLNGLVLYWGAKELLIVMRMSVWRGGGDAVDIKVLESRGPARWDRRDELGRRGFRAKRWTMTKIGEV